MALTITVCGSASGSYPPEEAALALAVAAEGPDRAEVARQVGDTHTRLGAQLRGLADSGAVGTWSSGDVRTYSHQAYDGPGQPGRTVHVATVSVAATFTDLEALSRATTEWLGDPLLTLSGVQWRLRRDSHQARTVEVRRAAVADAVAKAQHYADALAAGVIQPVEIADAGMLVDREGPVRPVRTLGAVDLAAGTPEQAGVELRPRDVEIRVAVDARFTAER